MRILYSFLALFLFQICFAQNNDGYQTNKYEYQIVTSIESIIPSGLGRSRLIASAAERDFNEFTTKRTEENKANKSSRSEIRVKEFEETKLLNFYNVVGIRFENIAANDALVSSKINDLANNGWELAFVNSGVESKGSADDTEGIFITRYIFKRLIK